MKNKVLTVLLILTLCVGTASAQFGGVVYDPTNYHNAVLRYFQLQQQLIQLRNSYAQLVAQYNLAVQMAKNIQNMPARYRASFLVESTPARFPRSTLATSRQQLNCFSTAPLNSLA